MRVSLLTLITVLVAMSIFIEECNSARNPARKRQRRRRRRPRPRRPTTRAPQPCPPIPHIDNGQGLDTGSTVQYACEPGFVLEGTNVITCIDGRWTVAPRCRRELCPIPPNVPFANPPQLSNGGVTATYTCLTNYRIVGGNGATTATVSCSTQTKFWPTLPSCELIPVVTCGGPPMIANAMSTVSNNIATYTCVTGYRRVAGTPSQIVCGSTGWPTVGLPMCEIEPGVTPAPVMCTTAPPCGDEKINREAVGDSYTIGSSVLYTCVTGHRIVGSNDNSNKTSSVFCKSDGTWTTTPTCEPVVCGVPPAGVNTVAVNATSISYPGTYTYACSANYETGATLETKCLADGKWSLDPAPTCTQIMCPSTALPTLANADFLSQNVAIGGTVTYTCKSDYRLAPQALGGALTSQTVTCQANKMFTALASTCVYIYPESCRDYFTRDGLFAAATTTCVTVIIDPQGPNLADPTNPPAATVSCCKTSATTFCTEVAPNAGTSYSNLASTCAGTTTPAVLPSTIFDGTISAVCDAPTPVTYSISETQIKSMIASTSGTCKQTTSITCTAADSLSLALAVNDEASGFLYGTNAFTAQGTDYSLDHYTYAGANCDCAESTAVVDTATCEGGCTCTNLAAATGTDTITQYLTPERTTYVTGYQLSSHDTIGALTAGAFTVSVGPISCCETF